MPLSFANNKNGSYADKEFEHLEKQIARHFANRNLDRRLTRVEERLSAASRQKRSAGAA